MYTATLEAIYSERDQYGNCYWALRFIDHATGHVVVGLVSGGESNINAIRLYWNKPDGWDNSILFRCTSMKKRAFRQLTADWPYAGCNPEDLAKFIKSQLLSMAQ